MCFCGLKYSPPLFFSQGIRGSVGMRGPLGFTGERVKSLSIHLSMHLSLHTIVNANKGFKQMYPFIVRVSQVHEVFLGLVGSQDLQWVHLVYLLCVNSELDLFKMALLSDHPKFSIQLNWWRLQPVYPLMAAIKFVLIGFVGVTVANLMAKEGAKVT